MMVKGGCGKVARLGAGALAGLLLLLGGQAAQAAVVTVDGANSLQDVGLVTGVSGSVRPFDIGMAGTYRVTLADFAFPADPFDMLRLIVTSATEEYARLDGPGSLLFTAGAGHYFLTLAWDAGGALDMGLYGVEIAASVVPVPPSVILLMSAIGLLAYLRYRGRGRDARSRPHAAFAAEAA